MEQYKPLSILLVSLETLDLTFTPGKLSPTWNHVKEFITAAKEKRTPIFLKLDPKYTKCVLIFTLEAQLRFIFLSRFSQR